MAQPPQRKEVGVADSLEDRDQVELDVTAGARVVIVAQQPKCPPVGEDAPPDGGRVQVALQFFMGAAFGPDAGIKVGGCGGVDWWCAIAQPTEVADVPRSATGGEPGTLIRRLEPEQVEQLEDEAVAYTRYVHPFAQLVGVGGPERDAGPERRLQVGSVLRPRGRLAAAVGERGHVGEELGVPVDIGLAEVVGDDVTDQPAAGVDKADVGHRAASG